MGMKLDQQQLWAEAQRRCRLSDEAVRMAKVLGSSSISSDGLAPSGSNLVATVVDCAAGSSESAA